MKSLWIILAFGLVGCSAEKPVESTYFCSTPVGPATGKGTKSWQGNRYLNVTFKTESGATVTAPWEVCIEVKE